MNRTDQAPEPTMEEILASIRLIISDDVKKGPSREEQSSRIAPPRPETAPLNALPEEEVLDLTDALVFPEEKSSLNGRVDKSQPQPTPAVASHEEVSEMHSHAQQDAVAEEPEAAEEENALQQPDQALAAAEPRQDFSRAAESAGRSIWSRREIPASPPISPTVSRYEAPGRQSQRNWAQDIQMPIPERGPVSLIPDQAHPQTHETQDLRQPAERDKAERNSDLPHSLGEEGEAAVAAIAESLARSAAGSMAPDELVTAGDVDFSKLREEKKAEVTETFANAIQRENAPHDKRPLPTLLDEVFRRDFIREPSPVEEPADDLPGSKASDAYEGFDKQADDERFGSTWGAPEIAVPITTGVRQARPVSNEPPARATQENVPVSPVAAREAEPVRPAASGSPLEEEVRGMLQPLLVQWLNEHMPRILETAIREEIATRGLSPKAEK